MTMARAHGLSFRAPARPAWGWWCGVLLAGGLQVSVALVLQGQHPLCVQGVRGRHRRDAQMRDRRGQLVDLSGLVLVRVQSQQHDLGGPIALSAHGLGLVQVRGALLGERGTGVLGLALEQADQVVQVGDDAMVKVIDIDLERRRISLSLKQANQVGTDIEDFDPTLYGMAAEYDEQGNYKYPEGFDPETNEWLEGYDEQRQAWEARYAESERRHRLHTAQIERNRAAAAEAAESAESSNYSSDSSDAAPASETQAEVGGSLASDEQLAALRDKLAGN